MKDWQRFRISIILIILNGFLTLKHNSQINLVPNSDFEQVDQNCFDTNFSVQLSFWYLKDWYPRFYTFIYDEQQQVTGYNLNAYEIMSYGTPDFYYSCTSYMFNTLSNLPNWSGFQIPYNGNGYIGLGYGTISKYREFIRTKLIDTLKQGQGYCFKLRYSLANHSNRALSHFGALFTTDSFNLMMDFNTTFIYPQIYSNLILSHDLDTVNWSLIEGGFVANGGEQWLTLGWFHPDYIIQRINTDFPIQLSDMDFGYYYLDALELIECPQYGVPDYEIIPPNVISPNGDGLNDAFFIHPYLPQPSSLIIYNRWGAEVFRSANYDQTWQGTTADGKPVTEGTYFYVLQLPSGTVKKGTVSVFR